MVEGHGPGGAAGGDAPPAACVSADLLAEGVSAGGVGVWRWNVSAKRLEWSHNMGALHSQGSPPGASFDEFLDAVHTGDRDRVRSEFSAVTQDAETYLIQYRLLETEGSPSRWLEARGRVFRDSSGEAVFLAGITQDITDVKNTEAELDLRARQNEAVVHLGERALAGAQQREIFDETVRLVAELAFADYAEILEISSDRDTLALRAAHGWREDLVETTTPSAAENIAGYTLRSTAPVTCGDFSAETRFSLSDTPARHGVVSGASVTIAGKDGMPFGVLAVYRLRPRCISPADVRFLQSISNVLGSAIRAAQDHERSELLIGELRHRVGNLFSLVQALHRQTGQNAQDAQDLEMKFGARLASLASAHSLILDGGWQKTSIRSLLQTTLAPYIERVVFSGTDVRMAADAAFSFSMALHELATNANKYGALHGAEGKLLIDTRSEPDALGNKLVLVWKESDGPPLPEAEAEGFGSKLIHQVVERQLGGQVSRVVEPDGLRITMEFPVR